MLSHARSLAPLLFALGGLSGEVRAQEPEAVPSLEQRVDLAIDRGVDYLLSTQARDGSWTQHQPTYRRGSTALAAYALRHAGLASDHPAVRRALAYLEAHPTNRVYSLGCELVLLGTMPGQVDEARVEALLERMLSWQGPDGWAYPTGTPDLSCIHFALFGLGAAEQLGVEPSRKDWERARKAILRYTDSSASQPVSGAVAPPVGFTYHARSDSPRASLTAAGAALLQLILQSESANIGAKGRAEAERAIERAKSWLDANWRVDTNVGSGGHQYYHLMAIERAGVLCGWDEVAGMPWYETGATWLLEHQNANGGWPESGEANHHETAMAILFLRRAAQGIATGSEPLASNILRAEDPGDAVHLCLRDEDPIRAWVSGFGLAARAELGTEGLRVARVEYLVNGELWETVEGGAGELWDGEQLVGRLRPRHRGAHEVRARVLLADAAGEPTGQVLESAPLTTVVAGLEEPWAEEFAGLGGQNLVRAGRPTVVASSANDPDPPSKAVDGLEGTWWLCEREDEIPVLRLSFKEKVKAAELWISPADGRLAGLGRFDRLLELTVTVDGVRQPFVVQAPEDPLAPLVLDFGKRRRISELEIAITRREPATVAPGLAGFNEVILR